VKIPRASPSTLLNTRVQEMDISAANWNDFRSGNTGNLCTGWPMAYASQTANGMTINFFHSGYYGIHMTVNSNNTGAAIHDGAWTQTNSSTMTVSPNETLKAGGVLAGNTVIWRYTWAISNNKTDMNNNFFRLDYNTSAETTPVHAHFLIWAYDGIQSGLNPIVNSRPPSAEEKKIMSLEKNISDLMTKVNRMSKDEEEYFGDTDSQDSVTRKIRGYDSHIQPPTSSSSSSFLFGNRSGSNKK